MSTGAGANHAPVRVMQVIHSFLRGGSERIACDLALALDRSRFRSSVCALDTGGPLAEELRQAGITAHVAGRRPGRDVRLVPALYRLFRQERVDLVQTHHLTQLIYGAIGARLAGATLVHVEHETFTSRSLRARRRLRMLSYLCHKVVAAGEETRDFLVHRARLPESRVTVIRNGIDLSRYRPGRRQGRDRFGIPPDGRWIGQVARLEEEKDQATLLRAFAIVRDQHPDARLVIVGDGSLRAPLEDLARALGLGGAVFFLGARSDVAEFLVELDAFVLSSVREGLPLALLEAMACEVPVVATAIGDVPRLLGGGDAGEIVSASDPQALAAAVARILASRERAAAMGRAARALVTAEYSADANVRRYQELYEELLPARSAGKPALLERGA